AVEYADFTSAEGKVLASNGKPPGHLTRDAGRTDLTSPTGEPLHLFAVPFTDGGVTKGYFRLVVNEREGAAIARTLFWTNFAVTGVVLLFAIPLAWFASRVLVRPILSLVGTAESIASGDLTKRTTIESNDEIGGLAETFNAMAGSLEKTVTR